MAVAAPRRRKQPRKMAQAAPRCNQMAMNITDVAHVYGIGTQAHYWLLRFVEENDQVIKVDKLNGSVHTKDGLKHWFMGAAKYDFWCIGRTYAMNGVLYHSGYPVKLMEVEE